MQTIAWNDLQRIGTALFDAIGSPHDESSSVSEVLVRSSLMGHDSHGIVRFVEYVKSVREKQLIPGAPFEILHEAPCLAIVDGHNGWGILTARKAMHLSIQKARQSGVGTVLVLVVGLWWRRGMG
jgi:LDH2 family malate/lactate/ureidoglycolate dehydrogenase